jgi:hypothetical protein
VPLADSEPLFLSHCKGSRMRLDDNFGIGAPRLHANLTEAFVSVTGSVGLTSNSRLDKKRVTASPPTQPTATPDAASIKPCRTIRVVTFRPFAPKTNPNPDFLRPLRHRIGDDAIDSMRSKKGVQQ